MTRKYETSVRRSIGTAIVAALTLVSSQSLAQGYTEGADLSNDPLAPTPVMFSLGDNLISGMTGRPTGSDPIDTDYFTFALGADDVLDSITVLDGTTTHNLAFIGIDSGNQVTVPGPGATGLLGWTHYDTGDIGSNILDDMSMPNMGSSGFGALGAGTYSVWIQEASPGDPVNYRFNFAIRSVPEPATWGMMLLGFSAVGIALRRRRPGQLSMKRAESGHSR